jgi:hypothetical protein
MRRSPLHRIVLALEVERLCTRSVVGTTLGLKLDRLGLLLSGSRPEVAGFCS